MGQGGHMGSTGLGQEAAGAGGNGAKSLHCDFIRMEQAEAWLVWITSGAQGHWGCPWLSGLTRAGGSWP